jgi:hypothetical protein
MGTGRSRPYRDNFIMAGIAVIITFLMYRTVGISVDTIGSGNWWNRTAVEMIAVADWRRTGNVLTMHRERQGCVTRSICPRGEVCVCS